MRDEGTTRRTYNVEEAARLLGIGRNQAYEAVRSGAIPSIRVGKRLLIPKAPFDRLLNGGGGPPLQASSPDEPC